MTKPVNPKFSIILPAYCEADIINAALIRLTTLDDNHRSEIIVVDGHPQTDTLKAIEDPRVIKVSAPKGRGIQMNKGADHAEGDILLFLHVDTRLVGDALNRIENAMDEKEIIGGAFDLGIRSDRRIFRIIEKIASLRSRFTRIPYGDQAIFMRKNHFQMLGGFQAIPIMEDVEMMKRVRADGGKIRILKQTVRTSPRRWESEGVLYCTLRNWILIALYRLGVSPNRLAKFYK